MQSVSQMLIKWDTDSSLAIETGGRQAEVTEAFLCRLIDIAGCGDASDRARFRNYAASRILMTNAIGVAKTIIANRPIASDAPQAPSQATLGFVPLPPPRQYRCNTPHSPILPLPGV